MNIWQIASRSIRQRWLASALTALSMALGVTLVVAVLTIHGVVSEQFRNNANLGYNFIVGAKGSPLQLTMNSVYYLSQPVENFDYKFYLEFVRADRRSAALKNSYAVRMHDAGWATMQLAQAAVPAVAGDLARPVAGDIAHQLSQRSLDLERNGKYAPYADFAIPLCMGDYFGSFRVVGTTPEFFEELPKYVDRKFEFAAGRNMQWHSEKNGYFEAVVGATVAQEMDLEVGSEISPAHGAPGGHTHENSFEVVGILKPSGTPNDRAVFVNMEGFLLMGDHAKPITPTEEEQEIQREVETASAGSAENHDEAASTSAAANPKLALEPLPLENREVTAMLLRTISRGPARFGVALRLPNLINEGPEAQVVQPVKEIYDLMGLFVKPVQQVLLLLTVLIVFVSGVSILVSIYNSMNERRHEIAVIRALGASRTTVMLIILAESLMLAGGGGLLGMVLGHTLNAAAAPVVERQTGVEIGFFDFAPPVHPLELFGIETGSPWKIWPELMLIPLLVGLAVLVGLLPALSAYRTDVADSLGK